jgi:exopolyphosphatase/guanosine-5'-triphosphate,3'-diphosphate pyrophosphatase
MRTGAVDIGSNALRAVVIEGKAGKTRFEVVEERREPVRLGSEVFGGTGYVSSRTASAAADAMRSFARDFRRLRAERVRAVATSAVREARNRRSFVSYLTRESGLSVDVITGAEEARLVSLAVRSRIPAMEEGRHLVLDVGGGSAEVIVVEDGEVARAESFDVGAVRLIEQVGEPHGASFLRVTRRLLDSVRERLREVVGPGRPGVFAATGGNIEAVAGILGKKAGGRPPVHAVKTADLAGFIEEMARLTPPQRMRRWDLKADRADVILPASVVYESFAREARAKRILVPHTGLRDSVALDLLLGAERRDARERLEKERVASAVALGRKYHFREEHARQTARLALRLFDRVGSLEGLGREDRDILEIAALLHDIGTVVSPIRHHKHTAYLIRESELAGVSPEEQELIAVVARYHRRGMPREAHPEYAALPARDRRRVALLAGILRIADALDRDRARPLEDVEVRLRGDRIELRLRGSGDRLLEVWAAERKKGLFEREFRREVVVRKA